MTTIAEVSVYRTDDGKIFDTRAEAEKHVAKLALVEKIDTDIYCRDTSAEEIADWIVGNLIFTYR